MSETNLAVTPGSGALVGGNTDAAGNFVQSVGIEDVVGGAVQNVLAAGSPQSQGNACLVAPTSWANTFSVTSVSAGTVYDVGNYGHVSVQITSQYVGTSPTVTFQTSNDGTNWYTCVLANSNSGTNGSTTGTGLFAGNIYGRYFRLNFTGAYSSGTAAGVIVFSTSPIAYQSVSAALITSSSNIGVAGSATGATVSANAQYQGLDGRNASPTAVTNGQLVGALSDLWGTQQVSSGGLLNTSVAPSASVTVVKASGGRLCRALVTVAGTSQAMTIYDNASAASGTVIGIIPSGATAGQVFDFHFPAASGITCSASTNNPTVTIGYI